MGAAFFATADFTAGAEAFLMGGEGSWGSWGRSACVQEAGRRAAHLWGLLNLSFRRSGQGLTS